MKKFTLFTIIFLIGAANGFSQTNGAKKKPGVKTVVSKAAKNPATTDREKFNPLADASADLQTAIAKAQKENKRIILDIGGEWCGWCHEMDGFIARNIELNKLRDENFVWLKVNFSEENENKEFLAKYPQIKGYPHLFVLEKDGNFLYSKDTSELEDGVKSYNLEKFTNFLNEYSRPKIAAK